MHNVPIYYVDVLVHIYEGKSFLMEREISKVMIKGFGRKYILNFRHEQLKKMTLRKLKLAKGQDFKIKDIRLMAHHGFGINEF